MSEVRHEEEQLLVALQVARQRLEAASTLPRGATHADAAACQQVLAARLDSLDAIIAKFTDAAARRDAVPHDVAAAAQRAARCLLETSAQWLL